MTALQEAALTGGGDCLDHYHLSDRAVTHQDWRQYVSLERVFVISSNGTSNIISPDIDIVLCKSTTGTTSIQLPNPALELKFTIVKTNSAGSIVITPITGTINGGASYTMTGVSNEYATFKAMAGNYHRIA